MARRTRRNIGIIGLGIIGSRVADNLRRKGIPVFVWNRTPRPVPNFVGSPIELAELCDIVQIFVSDDDALLEMVQRMKSSLNKQHIIIASSTVSPDTVRAAAEIIERRGGKLIDAPFTGSKDAAAKAELVYYVGGDPAAVNEVRPFLEASGKEVLEIGSVGQASAMKVATNIITAASVQAAAEALALIMDAGISPEKFAAAMGGNGSNSKTLDMKLPKMINGDLDVHFSVKHMLKDMAIASRIARSLGIEFGVADAARLALQAQQRDGRGDADYSAVIRGYFPQEGPLKPEPAAVERPDDQPTLTGLESRGSIDTSSEIMQKIFAAVPQPPTGDPGPEMPSVAASRPSAPPEAAPANEEPAPATHTDKEERPAAEPVAASSGNGAPTGEAEAAEQTNGEAVAVATVDPDESMTGGGLFRRFVRRGAGGS